MGLDSQVPSISDPDPSYELTIDNIYKILAIYMRFQANIPVVIIGETGCGKTKLIDYMCKLQATAYGSTSIKNLIIAPMHGGTTSEDIVKEVERAQNLAIKNHMELKGKQIHTVLFFDEANSTEAVGTIKEIMCDNRCNGKAIDISHGLKIIAACNPYKILGPEAIKNFKNSGLGYFSDQNEEQEMLGDVPIRNLVYRVQPLPISMIPMVWDFGTLSDKVERLYIKQIVSKRLGTRYGEDLELLIDLLVRSQRFARELENESSYVSLRDIHRALMVFEWFMENGQPVFENFYQMHHHLAIIMALNVCYNAGLQTADSRKKYWGAISGAWPPTSPLTTDLPNSERGAYFQTIVENCYDVFLDHIKPPEEIARNFALKENVFMMLICIHLRIPLFLIGKPGSSKSLAKTLVSQNMSGSFRTKSPILKNLKETQIINFQCSPHMTADNILKVVEKCARLQLIHQDSLDQYVSVAVLEEIGLAEASSSMPLKVLQTLLESGVSIDGGQNRTSIEEWRRPGFIGISNWILDPAKMNRGIFVNRISPDDRELKKTVDGIFGGGEQVRNKLKMEMIDALTEAYKKVCESTPKKEGVRREFFGLRDFYSLIKMIRSHLSQPNVVSPEWPVLQRFIRRNFGGIPGDSACETFRKEIRARNPNYPMISQEMNVLNLINEALNSKGENNRYILLIAEHEIALDILDDLIASSFNLIFGSAFPNDQAYAQLCRNIRKAKLNMEEGNTLAMLNMEDIYESLYDALNQFYYKFGEHKKFVEIGLGIQRCKISIDENFKAIIIAEKSKVYKSNLFPIPLINRLEKYLIEVDSLLDNQMKKLACDLDDWCQNFTSRSQGSENQAIRGSLSQSDVFNGITKEAIWWISYKIIKFLQNKNHRYELVEDKIKVYARNYFLQCVAADSVVRLKETQSGFDNQYKISSTYFQDQWHTSFEEFCQRSLERESIALEDDEKILHPLRMSLTKRESKFIQITTNSRLLTNSEMEDIGQQLQIEITQSPLLAFDTQQQMRKVLSEFFEQQSKSDRIFIIQCPFANLSPELVDSARLTIVDEGEKFLKKLEETDQKHVLPESFKVILILQTPKVTNESSKFKIYQTRNWFCYHIDDLSDELGLGKLSEFENKSLSSVLEKRSAIYDSRKVIKGSLFAACSRINNEAFSDHRDRPTKRLTIMQALLSQNNDISHDFIKVTMQLLCRLQKEREIASQNEPNGTNILQKISEISKVIKHGSNKSALNNLIRKKMANLLAGSICFADTNGNLDLIQDNQGYSRLWISMFKQISANRLAYKEHFMLPDKKTERNEFSCIRYANPFRSFDKCGELRLKLPFSWFIKERIEEFITETPAFVPSGSEDENLRERSNYFVAKFEKSSILKQLQDCVDECNLSAEKKAINSLYLSDLLLMSSNEPFVSKKHLSIVVHQVNAYCQKNLAECKDLKQLMNFHLALNALKEDIDFFGKFAEINRVLNLDNFETEEQIENMDSFSATILENKLTDVYKERFKNMEIVGWHEFFSIYRQCSSYISTLLLKLIKQDPSRNDTFKRLKSIWQKSKVCCYIYDHMVNLNETMLKRSLILWSIVEEQIDLTNIESFELFQEWIIDVKSMIERFEEGKKMNCNICGAQNSIIYQSNACQTCFVCKECQNEYTDMKICAGCSRRLAVPNDQIEFNQVNIPTALKIRAKINLVSLYSDIVGDVCFGDTTCRPEEKVVQAIIGDLMPNTRDSKAAQSSVYDFSPNPSVRSNIFKLLIKYKKSDVERYLEEIFKKLKQATDRQTRNLITELNLIYISSVEDVVADQASDVSSASVVALSKLKEYTEQDSESLTYVKKLEMFGNMRFVLTVFSKIVESKESTIYNELNETLRQKIGSSVSLKNFLIKLIVRQFGQPTIMKLTNELSWIFSKEGIKKPTTVTYIRHTLT